MSRDINHHEAVNQRLKLHESRNSVQRREIPIPSPFGSGTASHCFPNPYFTQEPSSMWGKNQLMTHNLITTINLTLNPLLSEMSSRKVGYKSDELSYPLIPKNKNKKRKKYLIKLNALDFAKKFENEFFDLSSSLWILSIFFIKTTDGLYNWWKGKLSSWFSYQNLSHLFHFFFLLFFIGFSPILRPQLLLWTENERRKSNLMIFSFFFPGVGIRLKSFFL